MSATEFGTEPHHSAGRQASVRRTVPSALALLIAALGCPAALQRPSPDAPPGQPLPSQEPGRVTLLGVDGSCSLTRLGTSVATVRWATAEAAPANQRIDVATWKLGFAQGVYASLWPVRNTTELRWVSPAPARGTRPGHWRDLRVAGLAAAPDSTTRSVRFEGLEPGVNYLWRVLVRTPQGWVATRTVTLQAPTCVAETLDRPRR